MVDSIKPSAPATAVFSLGKAQRFEDTAKAETPAAPVDEVRLSPEAVSLQEAQAAAAQIAAQPEVTLTADTARLNALV